MDVDEVSTGRRALLLRLLSGPAAFAAVRAVPLAGLMPEAHFAVCTYAWVLAWWVFQPVPWGVTSFLPFVLLPLGGVPFADFAAGYGHNVLPYLMGVMLFGHAFRKHGLARRIALAALCLLPGVARSGGGMILAILIVSAVMSAAVSDLVVIVTMTPIALSITRSVAAEAGRMATAASLAVLYGAAAGGLATPAGIPFNALTLSVLERLTGYSITFAQWTSTGVVLTAAHIPICWLVLKFMVQPEARAISDSRARLRQQRAQLGPMSRAEKNVLFVLILMLLLWVLPTFATIGFLDFWYVPPVAMVLLFALPVDAKRGEAVLAARDFQEGVGWNVLFLVLGGMALADVLTATGFTDWFAARLTAGVTAGGLPWLAGLVTPVLTLWANGAAISTMVATMLFPIADTLGYNPAILARIIAGTAQAVALPWSSAAPAATFAFGAVGLGTMFRVGAVVTALTSVVVIVLSMILVPLLQAFSVG